MNKKPTKKDNIKFYLLFMMIVIAFILISLMAYHNRNDCLLAHEGNCECTLCLERKHEDFCKCDLCSKLNKMENKRHLADCKYVECIVNHKEDCHNANCYCKCPTCNKCENFDTAFMCWGGVAGIILVWYAVDNIRERKQKQQMQCD